MHDWDQWEKTNEAYLAAALQWLRGRLVQLAEVGGTDQPPGAAAARKDISLESATSALLDDVGPPPALEILSQRLGLSPFERQVLLLCAAVEFDPRLPALCARAQDDSHKPYPTFALAMSALSNAAWDVLSPERPLRYWRLIEIHQPSGVPLTASALLADERIVSYLKGLNFLDERLAPLLSRLELAQPARLPDSQQSVVDAITARLRRSSDVENEPDASPVIQLLGPHQASKQLIAQHVAAELSLELQRLSAELLPSGIADLETLSRLWHRECLLLPMALYLDARELETGNSQSERLAALRRFVDASTGIVFLDTREAQQHLGRAATSIEIDRPTQLEQRDAWTAALGGESQREAAALSGQFNLCLTAIRDVTRAVQEDEPLGTSPPTDRAWDACRRETRPRLDGLAQRIDAKATRDDIVLPDDEAGLLQQIADQVRHRTTVYDDWGYRAKLNRGLGISALFAGDSGTGKTMAAEVIANELQLDLFRIDLSAVVNKYIGETEKNLCRLFDAAEEGGVILFFDEADALFGKRTEVKDSHDRYANIEVNYLLQRMESYRGLAILATNMKSTLDKAFLRRLRFLVDFPFPAASQRKSIWQKTFPRETPLAPLDYKHLARLKLTGGNIHSIALNAAFTAAANGGVVTMPHILTEAKAELRKLNKPINAADFVWRENSEGQGMNVNLHIERVVLDFPATEHQRVLLEQALGEQLQGLIEQRGLSPALLQGGAFDQVRGGQIAAAPGGGNWGNDLATAIFEGIGPGDPSA